MVPLSAIKMANDEWYKNSRKKTVVMTTVE